MQTAASLQTDYPITELTLNPGIFTIGCAADNDIVLNEPGISDYHAKLVTYFHQSVLVDLSSEGGSYLNGARVIRHSINNGDLIKLGNHVFKIRLRPDA
jgi:pSer/pThr/pTyr-binding forkhead associated (FHA) protein